MEKQWGKSDEKQILKLHLQRTIIHHKFKKFKQARVDLVGKNETDIMYNQLKTEFEEYITQIQNSDIDNDAILIADTYQLAFAIVQYIIMDTNYGAQYEIKLYRYLNKIEWNIFDGIKNPPITFKSIVTTNPSIQHEITLELYAQMAYNIYEHYHMYHDMHEVATNMAMIFVEFGNDLQARKWKRKIEHLESRIFVQSDKFKRQSEKISQQIDTMPQTLIWIFFSTIIASLFGFSIRELFDILQEKYENKKVEQQEKQI